MPLKTVKWKFLQRFLIANSVDVMAHSSSLAVSKEVFGDELLFNGFLTTVNGCSMYGIANTCHHSKLHWV